MSHESGQPCNTNCNTRDNNGLRLVSFLTSLAYTGEESRCSISSTISGGSGTASGTSGKGSRLSVSAFPCAEDFLNCKVYSYKANIKAQRRMPVLGQPAVA